MKIWVQEISPFADDSEHIFVEVRYFDQEGDTSFTERSVHDSCRVDIAIPRDLSMTLGQIMDAALKKAETFLGRCSSPGRTE